MAKPKAKPRKPKLQLHTWSVNVDGAITTIEAEACMVGNDLVFYRNETMTRAVAAGHWATCELIEPTAS